MEHETKPTWRSLLDPEDDDTNQLNKDEYLAAGTEKKAFIVSRFLKGTEERSVRPDAPTLCTEKLYMFPYQRLPSKLIYPGSPIKRIFLVLPPGAGKTATALEIIGRFTGLRKQISKIIIVGDYDIIGAFAFSAASTPATVQNSKGESMIISDFNKGDTNPLCHMNTDSPQEAFPKEERATDCTDTISGVKILWLTYVNFGNLLETWSKDRPSSGSKYRNWNPHDEHTVIIIDEAHQLANPATIKTPPSWKRAPIILGEQLSKMGTVESKNPYIIFMTATPILESPVEAICLATVLKGRSDPEILTAGSPTIDPKLFLDPAYGYVTKSEYVTVEGSEIHIRRIQETFKKFRALPRDKNGSESTYEADHPCPIATHLLASNVKDVLELTGDHDKLNTIKKLFANLFYVINTLKDHRYTPSNKKAVRRVYVEQAQERELEKAMVGSTQPWINVTNCTDHNLVKALAERYVSEGELSNEEEVSLCALAPKWKAICDDINSGRYVGKMGIYVGSETSGDVLGAHYLFALSLLLQKRCGYGCGSRRVGGEHRIFLHSDAIESEYLPKDTSNSARVAQLQSIKFRKRQDEEFNDGPCTDGRTSTKDLAIILIGSEGYKAFNLVCCSNIVILVPQSIPRYEQTAGRAIRTCIFKRVTNTKLWHVTVTVYQMSDPPSNRAPRIGVAMVDVILTAFYDAQYKIIEDLLDLIRATGIGCSTLLPYNNFEIDDPGFSCALDNATDASVRGLNRSNYDFFRSNGTNIVASLSGDVSSRNVELSSRDVVNLKRDDSRAQHEANINRLKVKKSVDIGDDVQLIRRR